MLYRLVRPLFFAMPPEGVHHAVSRGMRVAGGTEFGRAALSAILGSPTGDLPVEMLGLRFRNPVGVAAGFDKEGVLVDALGALGFGHVEVGTVTPRPQPGNPPPRIFRLPRDGGLINRLGFPSEGLEAMDRALAARAPGGPVVGISIGKNKTTPASEAPEDYRRCYRELQQHADYFAVNVSSPNTPGLRDLGVGRSLDALLAAVMEARQEAVASGQRRVPVLVKVAPDLLDADLDDAIDRSLAQGVEGFIASNTTVSRAGLRTPGNWSEEAGGLSGAPLRERAREVVRHIAVRTEGRVPIIGVGGIATGEDAYAMIRSGASMVQVYTSFIYGGPGLAAAIVRGLRQALHRDGAGSIAEVVGVDARER